MFSNLLLRNFLFKLGSYLGNLVVIFVDFM